MWIEFKRNLYYKIAISVYLRLRIYYEIFALTRTYTVFAS